MPSRRNHRERIGKQTWPMGVWIILALLLVAATRSEAKLYVVPRLSKLGFRFVKEKRPSIC